MGNKLNYNELMELVNSVKMYSGCNEVKLAGNPKTFEEVMAMGFPLADFRCEESFELDESQLYIIPINDLRG